MPEDDEESHRILSSRSHSKVDPAWRIILHGFGRTVAAAWRCSEAKCGRKGGLC